ncbi:armadillo repeat-containing protein 2 [Aplochiton taeniatus]
MASLEKKHGKASPFTLKSSGQRKTSAEIVNEARQSLRTLRTQRPFTPRDNDRHLFADSSARAHHDSRPSSTFSLHARSFDSADSRPGSGTRLSPLEHKPRRPLSQDEEPIFPKAQPKPPSDPLAVRRGVTGARARLLKAGSLTSLQPVAQSIDEKEGVLWDSSPEQMELSSRAGGTRPPTVPTTDSTAGGQDRGHGGPLKAAPCRTASESGARRPVGVDSSIRPRVEGPKDRTELGNGDRAAAGPEEAEEALVWSTHIAPLLQELETTAACGADDSVERICDLCDRLHGALVEQGMLGRRYKKRTGLLKTLFRLVDLNSAQLDLQLAKLCLALKVSGNNLLNICKLVFKISRSESNDVLFQNNSILDSLLCVLSTEDVCASGEAFIYSVGTVKFLSGNTSLLRLLLDKGFVGVAQQLLHRLHPLSQPGHAQFAVAGHILVQLTATLRNLADLPESRPLFVSYVILSELCMVLRCHHNDQDICTNVARIYSKLSSYSECCLALAKIPGIYTLFIELLSKHRWKQDLVVRLLFTLGNLTSKSDTARELLSQVPECMGTLLQLYPTYRDGAAASPPASPPAAGWRRAEDVLVKLLRVLANMSIHPVVGPALAANGDVVQLLLEILELRSTQESEELLVNVAATINNLSFYQGQCSVIKQRAPVIAKLMLKLLLCSSMEAVLEATRVYGNLSQARDVRDFIMLNRVHQFLLTLLDSKSGEVCFSACGVLTNLALDPPSRFTLLTEGVTAKLTDCLKDLGPGDWQLAGLVCQTLWNLTEEGAVEKDSATVGLEAQDREALLDILTAYLDEEEALQWTASEEMKDFHRACWEMEFLPVAQRLMKRLQSLAE